MVYLRPILPEDQERILDILTSPLVSKTYMTPDFKHREDAVQLSFHLMEMCEHDIQYVRAIAAENGFVGFLNMVAIKDNAVELGYVIHPDFHGKGYMTQALQLAMDELFSMGYHEIIAGAFSTNTASIRVMEKCGMERIEKTEQIEYRGARHNCIYYSKKSPSPMRFTCCFCGKTVSPWEAYTLSVSRTNDPEGTEQDLYCHRKCLEKKLRDSKLLYLNYI